MRIELGQGIVGEYGAALRAAADRPGVECAPRVILRGSSLPRVDELIAALVTAFWQLPRDGPVSSWAVPHCERQPSTHPSPCRLPLLPNGQPGICGTTAVGNLKVSRIDHDEHERERSADHAYHQMGPVS